VRYLKTLHGMFAGDWRLAVMAYNAGEYRVLGALKRSGQTARDAKPEALVGLSPITQAYVRKLHALSCLLEQADDREEWLHALDRPVPLLQAVTVPDGTTDIAAWARRTGQDAARLQRLNPAFVGGRITREDGKPARLLAVATGGQAQTSATPIAAGAVDAPRADSVALAEVVSLPPTPEALDNATASATSSTSSQPVAEPTSRHHTVVRGDSPWKIAARYGIRVADLLQRNGLDPKSVLKPGKVLVIDAELVAGSVGQAAGTP
jgi:membrane-bound lytic murein transglycosylase D